MKQKQRIQRIGTRGGFTLIELMITIAIIGILAAIAIPIFSKYVDQSKASEVFANLQGIRDKEESYFDRFGWYTGDLPAYPYDPGNASAAGVCGDTHTWGDPAPIPAGWRDLNFVPDGPTYYTYQVESGYTGPNLTANYPTTPGTTWPAQLRPWFRAWAFGDLDCNGVRVQYFISSHAKNPFKVIVGAADPLAGVEGEF